MPCMIVLKKLAAAVLFVIAAASAVATAQVCTPAPVGLVSWWAADGNALDARSRLNGTLVGDAGFAAGHAGQAFNLDGSGDSVQIAADPALNISGDFTAEAWIFPRSLPNIAPRVFDKDLGGAGGFWQLAVANDGTFVNALVFSSTGGLFLASPNNSVTLGQWNHVAVTVSAGGGTKLYVNGVEVATTPQIASSNNNAPLLIGDDFTGTRDFDGLIDEPGIFARTLPAAEIAAIHAAGTAGKCKPTATAAPPGLVGWWPGDGDAADAVGSGDGALQGDAGFAVGRVSQGLRFDGTGDAVGTPTSTLNGVTSAITIEAWVFPVTHGTSADPGGFGRAVVSKTEGDGFALRLQNGVIQADLRLSAGSVNATFGPPLPLNEWSNVIVTYDGASVKAFLNGTQTGSSFAASGTILNAANSTTCLMIGNEPTAPCAPQAGGFDFDGLIDEVSIYDRALTDAEIVSIFNAGLAGKLKQAATPAGSGVAANANGDATVTFPTVTAAGITHQIPLAASVLPPLPNGTHTGLVYDIATSAAASGSPTVCFNLPSFTTSGPFGLLRVMHLESGTWENRTASSDFATRTLCAQVPSLSPFAIVSFPPSAAPADIAGRVTDSNGRGIRGAYVTSTAQDGTSRTAVTNSFGYYRISGLPSGEAYTVTVSARQYTFANPTQFVSLASSISDLDFRALPRFRMPVQQAPVLTIAQAPLLTKEGTDRRVSGDQGWFSSRLIGRVRHTRTDRHRSGPNPRTAIRGREAQRR